MPIIPIPSYHRPCLAADGNSQSFYLIGSPTVGVLDINYVTDINANTVNQVGTNTNTDHWNIEAPKACFRYPSPQSANGAVMINQFGENTTRMTTAYPNGTMMPPQDFKDYALMSPKLFAWSGSFADYDMFVVFTSHTSVGTKSNWAGVRQSFKDTDTNGLMRFGLSHFPTAEPLLALGTYTPSTGAISSGYTVVIDKSMQAMAYLTNGNVVNATDAVITLFSGTLVTMNGISLSSDAIPVTMGSTGYILDKAKDGISTVIYSITPGTSFALREVVNKGPSPPFLPSMAAAALNQRIITYTAPDGSNAYFNSFDTRVGTWGGPGLVSGTKASLGAIIGGVIGGLVVVAIAVVFFVRCRRHKAYASTESPEPSKPTDNLDWTEQEQGQVEQEYHHPPSFIPPPPPVNKDADVSHRVYRTMSTESDLTVLDPSVYCPSYVSPTSYRDSCMTTVIPEYSYVEPRKSSSSARPLSPQYVPMSTIHGPDGRAPQTFSSTFANSP
ncbi:hypothetical protein BGX33_006305 [Mortierella sp. NVP41]|nr:hypothetical protein BGX33_006305 [Mortierella sp. NVP41]